MRIVVCWKWITHHTDGDPDARWAGVSPADMAALEIALSLRDRHGSADARVEVEVIALAPVEGDEILRQALAVGADRVVRIDASTLHDSRVVADAIATCSSRSGAPDLVICGDYSLDRGTGSVPAFLAADLAAAQTLGAIAVDTVTLPSPAQPMRVVRRLDGGRRELVDVRTPAVVSVEGSAARLRRAPLASALAAKRVATDVVPGPHRPPTIPALRPYRPRARILPPPTGSTLHRVRDILDIGSDDAAHAETVTLDPDEAAARIVDQLVEWGYLDAGGTERP